MGSRGAEGRCHGTIFWLSMGYNFGCVIASHALFDSTGGFAGSSYPLKIQCNVPVNGDDPSQYGLDVESLCRCAQCRVNTTRDRQRDRHPCDNSVCVLGADTGAGLRGGARVRSRRFHDVRRSESDRFEVRRRPVLKRDGRPHRTCVGAVRRHDAAVRLRRCRRLPSQQLVLVQPAGVFDSARLLSMRRFRSIHHSATRLRLLLRL